MLSELYAKEDYLKHLDVSNGLSQNTVNVIYEDKFGLVWIGTNDGLNRFEGEKLKIFSSNTEDQCSLVGDRILDIEQDNKYRLWLATAGQGLSYYNYKSNCFEKAKINYKPNQNLIVAFTIDTTDNTIWAATDGAGIFSFNYVTKRKIEFNTNNIKQLTSNIMSAIYKIDDLIYVGTSEGQMIIINPKSNSTKIYKVDNSRIQTIDKYGEKFLIGTTNHGYFIYDINNKSRNSLAYNENGEVIRNYGVVKDSYQVSDSSYILTFSTGISYIDINKDTIYIRKTINRFNNDIAYDYFNCVTIDSKGTEWFGSNGFGLFYNNEFFSTFKTIQNNVSSLGLSFSSVRAIELFDEKLWIGGYGGINIVDLKTKEVTIIKTLEYYDDKNQWTDGIHTQSVYCFYKDPNFDDLLLIGSEGNGMHQYSKSKKKFKTIKFGKSYGNEEDINSVFQIEKFGKNLLLGTSKGLYAYEPISETHSKMSKINSYFNRDILLIKSLFQMDDVVYLTIDGLGVYKYYLNESKLEEISLYFPKINKSVFTNSNKIIPYKDKLLLATKESGLYILDIVTGQFKNYNTSNGLINDCVYEILDDSNNNLWVSTNRGISKINLINESITNYNSAIFNLNSEFNSNAALKINNKLFYFGGTDGVVYFNPLAFNPLKYKSNLIIKTIELNNDSEVFNFYFVENDTIKIDYLDDLVQVKFTTNEYLFEKGIIYSCRINNSKWKKVKNNEIKLSGLTNGLNKIEVKIYNEIGEVSEIKFFYIEVDRPIWKSKWFYILIILLLLLTLTLIYIRNTKKLKIKLLSITRENRQLHANYNKQRDYFDLIDNNSSSIIWQTDKEYNLIFSTSNLFDYYKIHPTTKLNLKNIYLTEDLEYLTQNLNKKNNFKNKIEINVFHNQAIMLENKYSLVTVSKNKDRNGDFTGLTGVVNDTTEKEKTKKQLNEKEALFSTLVGTILEPVIITSWEGKILFANDEAKNVLEITINDIPEKNLHEYSESSNHELRKEIFAVKNGESFQKKQFELIVRKNRKKVEGSGTQIIYLGRNVFLFTFRDVTQRINLINELTIAKINAERSSELKTMYLSNLTHELKTPINAISGFTDIILTKYSESTNKSYLESIKLSTNLLIQLINDLLFYTKAESGKLELRLAPTNLKRIMLELESIFKLEIDNKGLNLTSEVNTNGIDYLLSLDQLKFKQIIINLLNNAIKYTEKGKINIIINLSTISKSQVDLELIVEDTGKGIPKARLHDIFNAFKQVNLSDESEGFGLGLAIVSRILNTMNGNIKVESKFGKGSKFIVNIKNINLVLNKSKKTVLKYELKLIEEYISKDEKLNIYSLELLEEINIVLNGRFANRLKNIKTNFLLKDISDFANQLKTLAEEKEIKFLVYYADELLEASKSIEVEKINNLLENFYKLLELINKLIENRNGKE